MTAAEALHASPDGVLIDVEVTPGASRPAFPSGYNEWRRRIEARVGAPAEGGRANAELVDLVAAAFDVPRRQVRVVAGAASRQKRMLVMGVSVEEAARRVSDAGRTVF